jgi:hypothetical protein
MSRIAAAVVIAGIVLAAVGIGLYDYRAGLVVFGVCSAAAGIWTLTQET